jgi:hypothetical protein
MPLGHVLYESGDEMRHVYFPTDSIVSLLYVMEDGSSAEIAIMGNEGIVGISLFMGGESGPVQHVLLRYTQALITQMSQTAVCNRHHTVEQQLCRWLLMSLDRLASNELTMTQELIANIQGCGAKASRNRPASCRSSALSSTAVATSRCSTGSPWKRTLASAIKWSRPNLSAYSRRVWRPSALSLNLPDRGATAGSHQAGGAQLLNRGTLTRSGFSGKSRLVVLRVCKASPHWRIRSTHRPATVRTGSGIISIVLIGPVHDRLSSCSLMAPPSTTIWRWRTGGAHNVALFLEKVGAVAHISPAPCGAELGRTGD